MRRWFGGQRPIGVAYAPLAASLPGERDADALIGAIADLAPVDFVRAFLLATEQAGDGDAPLDTPALLRCQHDLAHAQRFVDSHLRLTGLRRQHLALALAEPEIARQELLALLRRHQVAMRPIELAARDERERAAERLRALVAPPVARLPTWLPYRTDFARYSSLTLVPLVFHPRSVTPYSAGLARTPGVTAPEHPLLLLIGVERILSDAPRRGPTAAALTLLANPADHWARVYGMLADPSRLRILRLLAERPRSARKSPRCSTSRP